jgi:O-acetyl-ADP-ribose deacetylase (regulator of RNase III)
LSLIEVCLGDLASARADAIVTSASEDLSVSGGVNGAIHAAAGPSLADACRAVGTAAETTAFSTSAGHLNARRVIHAVPPRRHDPELLAATYRAVLERAATDGCASVALPSLATGAFGFPLELAAETAVATIAAFEPLPPLVRIWTNSEAAYEAYAARVAALPAYLRATRREDYWFDKLEADPLSATHALPWERTLEGDEAAFVRAGVYPREMEDKWFVYECDGTVHCHRSWTGYEIFSFRIRGALLDQLQVCADPERFKSAGDDVKALELADGFIDSLASGRLR